MQLRCKAGDLALIVHDEPGCESNIGRIVQVRGPMIVDSRALPCWLIKPVVRKLWKVNDNGSISSEIVYWKSYIEHPDCWMVPLRPPESDEQAGELQSEPEHTPEKVATSPPMGGTELEIVR